MRYANTPKKGCVEISLTTVFAHSNATYVLTFSEAHDVLSAAQQTVCGHDQQMWHRLASALTV